MSGTGAKSIRLYVIEEQEIYRELYKSVLPSRAELLQVSSSEELDRLGENVSALQPSVLLLSTKKLGNGTIEELETVRHAHPRLGVVLLIMSHDAQVIESLRKLTLMSNCGGMALFMKQSLDLTDQLCSIITAVNQGQVILDPLLTTLLLADKSGCPFLKELTSREVEILSLVSLGYTNGKIAESLYIDVKTVEHHINSTYSKLKCEADFSQRHPRVSAARLYLEAIGELSTTRT